MQGFLTPLPFELLWQQPWLLVLFAFQVWMLVDAVRRQEWFWAVFIFIFPVLNAILYYFLVYRAQGGGAMQGFELPGTFSRERIKELQAQIHHLDKAHHHAALGDVYFHQGKLDLAEQSYRAAIERDGSDTDFQAHLGQCLLRQGKAQEAAALLEVIVRANPRHDYGHTQMAYAEALALLGRKDEALAIWKHVLEFNSYARARVQLAELYAERGEAALARQELTNFLTDENYSAKFQQKQDKMWIKRAKALQKRLG